ncbi:MAG: hypothetical protein ACXQS4_05120, partial [Methermicoccaceae archaeon]
GERTTTGGAGVIVDGGDEGGIWTYAFPFWLEPSAQEVSSDERLRLVVDTWCRSVNNVSTNYFKLQLTANSDDLYVNLPIV